MLLLDFPSPILFLLFFFSPQVDKNAKSISKNGSTLKQNAKQLKQNAKQLKANEKQLRSVTKFLMFDFCLQNIPFSSNAKQIAGNKK